MRLTLDGANQIKWLELESRQKRICDKYLLLIIILLLLWNSRVGREWHIWNRIAVSFLLFWLLPCGFLFFFIEMDRKKNVNSLVIDLRPSWILHFQQTKSMLRQLSKEYLRFWMENGNPGFSFRLLTRHKFIFWLRICVSWLQKWNRIDFGWFRIITNKKWWLCRHDESIKV